MIRSSARIRATTQPRCLPVKADACAMRQTCACHHGSRTGVEIDASILIPVLGYCPMYEPRQEAAMKEPA